MRYPNGKEYKPLNKIDTSDNKKHYNLKDNASNRGMLLEEDISSSCEFYNQKGLCLIYKRATPIKVVKMDNVNKAKITEAYFNNKSTTDYNGLYRGKYLDFEAKETINKTSFSFHNIRPQQITHLDGVDRLNGLAFFVIRMKAHDQTFLIKYSDIKSQLNSSKKSVTYEYLLEKGIIIKESFSPRLLILEAVDEAFFDK